MKRQRAGWRIDAKWLMGVLLTIFLISTLMVYSFYQATEEKSAKRILTPLIREASGLDEISEKVFGKLIQLAQLKPDQRFEIPGGLMKITLIGRDIAGKTEGKLKTIILERTFETIYREGFEAPPASSPQLVIMAVVINFFSQPSHNQLGAALGWLFTICVILAIFLILLSYRFGKLSSLGTSLIFAAFPGLFASRILEKAVPEGGESEALSQAAKIVASFIWGAHIKALLIGFILILLGTIGSVVFWLLSEGQETRVVERTLPR